ncbi:MAG: Rieske 2Fe-2S domain-containing protein [Candidatus Binataceae bacterium]|nr:Rieske 2Fe-2S domain-containing protein [Candidatus Binataceae bacterium]
MASVVSNPELVNSKRGLVSRQLFMDPEIYQTELERVYARCWLYLGHESQVKEHGDYLSNYMGEDPIILWRDGHDRVRAYLNSCLHRGMKVCRTDAGSARSFTCSYHGWTYNAEGKLTGVPYFREAYFGELNREEWGLKEVPRVVNYGGFIFGCWDESAISLEEYLGDVRWYLDILIERPLGRLEVLPGMQRYKLPGNWKIQADNFAGDVYHVPFAHGSWGKTGMPIAGGVTIDNYATQKAYSFAFKHGHGALDMRLNDETYEADLVLAQQFGPETVDYIRESRERLLKRLSERQARIYTWGVGNLFPNFAVNNFSAFFPVGLYLWHPKGPDKSEVWQWCAVDSAAPAAVKEMARVGFTKVQSAGGFFGQDDSDNFEQVTEATRGVIGRRCWFNYQMGLGHEEDLQMEGYPGHVTHRMSEANQRNFYAYWSQLMERE